MRLVAYNVEWFASLFDEADQLRLDDGLSGRHDATRRMQAEALMVVFRALDADAVLVVEAPNSGRTQSSTAALQHFAAAAGIRARSAVMGFANDTQQELALLFDPDVLTASHQPEASLEAPRFDGTLKIDLDIDARLDSVRFSKPPLELALTRKGGQTLTLIGAHLKSKAPHGAHSEDDVIRRSIANRRKQLAQAIWLRRRMDAVLAQGRPLVVMGDLNDGPGLDRYEALFGRSSVEILLGEEMTEPHAQHLLRPRSAGVPSTARFYNADTKRYFNALLDYAMISPNLKTARPRWRIWHPFEDAAIYADSALREALLMASDHFPVVLDLDLP